MRWVVGWGVLYDGFIFFSRGEGVFLLFLLSRFHLFFSLFLFFFCAAGKCHDRSGGWVDVLLAQERQRCTMPCKGTVF